MAKKYGIQLRGLGRALRPSGLGTLRPKPAGKGGRPLRQKPIRPSKKKDGGKIGGEKRRGREAPRRNLKKVEPNQKGLQQLPKDVRNKMGYMKDGGKAKKFPDLTGDGKVTRADVLKGRGVFRKGGRANTRRMNRLEELGRVDSEKAYSRKGKRNLKSEKRRIVRELNK
tara:strand:- start:35 stop:541 length:507 start_codon:yes stop_codon:yes gene_type:complete